MVNPRVHIELRRLEGIVRREVDVQEEHTPCVWRVVGPLDGCLPVVLVILVNGAGREFGRVFLAYVN